MGRLLSRQEEFEILKIVIDKILLLGFAIMGYGAYVLYNSGGFQGFFVLITGVSILLIAAVILLTGFEVAK